MNSVVVVPRAAVEGSNHTRICGVVADGDGEALGDLLGGALAERLVDGAGDALVDVLGLAPTDADTDGDGDGDGSAAIAGTDSVAVSSPAAAATSIRRPRTVGRRKISGEGGRRMAEDSSGEQRQGHLPHA
ncbi:MAG TPA: hypothetical protein VGN37_04500 [Actinocatenispora sp.]